MLNGSRPLAPAPLYAAPPPPLTSDVTQLAFTVISSVLADNPNVGISVWAPRASPTERKSGKLKWCNANFLELCDVAAFADNKFESIFVTRPVCLSRDTEALLQASLERALAMADATHRGEIVRARSYFLHLSRVGRQKRVTCEMIAVFAGAVLTEFIFVEELLKKDVDFTNDLCHPYGFNAIPYPRNQPTPTLFLATEQARSCAGWNRTPETPLKRNILELKWKKPQAPVQRKIRDYGDQNWKCAECSATETTQRRRGPAGPLTLCNRCGLRWIKVLEPTSASL